MEAVTGTEDTEVFRREVRAWLKSAAPRKGAPDDFSAAHTERAADHASYEQQLAANMRRIVAWQRTLDDVGWGALGWPPEYGGVSESHRKIFAEEQARVGVTTKPLSVGIEMVGPTLIALGTEEQKERYLRPLRRGEEVWCQLFSEPDAGSDLPSLRTTASQTAGGWSLNGQKVWTSGASCSQFGLALARTDPSKPRHAGISAFIVDMASPGVEVRPLRQISGAYHFNEVFLNGVPIPYTALIGEVGKGWDVATTMLAHERASLGGGTSAGSPDELIDLARRCQKSEDARVRNRLASLYSDAAILQWSIQRAQTGRDTRVVGLLKLMYSEHARRMTSAALDVLGVTGVAGPIDESDSQVTDWQNRFLFAPGLRIAGGSDEIQRNSIAERILGLPREVRPIETTSDAHGGSAPR
jgi:alkylation response protein AidB-like acyl-CoA dehydrogenase